MTLAPYAADPARSRGRLYPEAESHFRTAFQRDRDRIIHSSAFRRLKHKTQVFVEHEGDYYRTRLTHSIEVAQVARTIAGALQLNTELAEAVALAHDLGHPPFGHTGEDELHALMAPYGGYDHNAQALRIVTRLERHYAEWDGLNLTWETLEGIGKHNGPVAGPLPYPLAEYNAEHDLELDRYATAEAQSAAVADDIAYNHHDLQDGLRAGLFALEELSALPLVGPALAEVDRRYPGLDTVRRSHETLRRFFGVLVEDVIRTAQHAFDIHAPQSSADIHNAGVAMVRFSDAMIVDLRQVREFLFAHMYRAPQVVDMRGRVAEIIQDLFPHYLAHPHSLPAAWQEDIAAAADETALARIVCDYLSGMTDRFAIEQHRLFFPEKSRALGVKVPLLGTTGQITRN